MFSINKNHHEEGQESIINVIEPHVVKNHKKNQFTNYYINCNVALINVNM